MILSAHLLVGAAIGSKIKNYWAIGILAIISHFALDAIPHWEYAGFKTDITNMAFVIITLKALIDISIGLGIVVWILKSSRLIRPAIFGAFCALIPDGLVFIYILAQVFFNKQLSFLAGPIALHNKAHYIDGDNLLLWRVLAELIIIIAAIFIFRSASAPRLGKKQKRTRKRRDSTARRIKK